MIFGKVVAGLTEIGRVSDSTRGLLRLLPMPALWYLYRPCRLCSWLSFADIYLVYILVSINPFIIIYIQGQSICLDSYSCPSI